MRKLEIILENMEYDSQVLWVDNDIVFFENCIQNIQSHDADFVMQDDTWSPCTGFFLVRPSSISKEVLRECINKLHKNKDNIGFNDQTAFLYAYREMTGFKVTLLSKDEYPNGYVYFNENRKSNARMVHCNYLKTTSEKEERLKDHNLWNIDEDVFNSVKKYFV